MINLCGIGYGSFHAKKRFFIWKAMHNRVPTSQYHAFSKPDISDRCPRRNSPETTIHILRDVLPMGQGGLV